MCVSCHLHVTPITFTWKNNASEVKFTRMEHINQHMCRYCNADVAENSHVHRHHSYLPGKRVGYRNVLHCLRQYIGTAALKKSVKKSNSESEWLNEMLETQSHKKREGKTSWNSSCIILAEIMCHVGKSMRYSRPVWEIVWQRRAINCGKTTMHIGTWLTEG